MSETAILLIKLLENSASGIVVVFSLGVYMAYKSGLLTKLMRNGNGKPESQTDEYRRREDRDLARLTTAIETLNQILAEVSATQKGMSKLLERQEREMDGAIDRQKDMKETQDDLFRKVRQIHEKVVVGQI